MPDDKLNAAVDRITKIIEGRRVCVLTGAGISTDSGIPDYRGPEGSLTKRAPIRYHDFVRSSEERRRYWARSCRGWPFMRARRPNIAHEIVAQLQKRGIFGPLITQNVDGLHRIADSSPLLELHGALDTVVCLQCGRRLPRLDLQREMEKRNPDWLDHAIEIAPDGDAELDPALVGRFETPVCPRCGGALKPDVVLFGESVPRDRVQRSFTWVEGTEVLLVLGSSLTVYSGYRFAENAARAGKPVVLVNLGENRADPIAALKVDAPLAGTLTLLARRFGLDLEDGSPTGTRPTNR